MKTKETKSKALVKVSEAGLLSLVALKLKRLKFNSIKTMATLIAGSAWLIT